MDRRAFIAAILGLSFRAARRGEPASRSGRYFSEPANWYASTSRTTEGGIVAFNMFFVNASGDHIGTGKSVRLGGLDSEKIELDGDAAGIAGVLYVILGSTNTFSDSFFTASLEIIDKTTGD